MKQTITTLTFLALVLILLFALSFLQYLGMAQPQVPNVMAGRTMLTPSSGHHNSPVSK